MTLPIVEEVLKHNPIDGTLCLIYLSPFHPFIILSFLPLISRPKVLC